MDLSISAEREALRSSVRQFLTDRSPASKVMLDMETGSGYDAALWADLVALVGVVGTWSRGPADDGGCFRDVAVVLEELGRSLACVPFLSTAVLATSALQLLRESWPPAADHLQRMAAGRMVATVALPGDGARALQTERSADAIVLTGRLPTVLDGHLAQLVLAPATYDGQAALVAVTGDIGIHREALLTMDRTRRFAALTFTQAPIELVATGPDVDVLLAQLNVLALSALAAEQVGGARRCVELSTAYARTRQQFGVPIGTFQAVKHMCANMLASVELAQSAAAYAAWCVDEDPAELPVAAHMAKSLCSEAFRSVGADTIQVHGGIGFTWDHPAHLYYKRAKSSELFLGQPAAHRAELADLLNL